MPMTTKQVPATERRKPPAAGKGRPKGSKNKTTTALKEAILEAAKLHGQDGRGEGGLVGYLKKVAEEDTKAFCALLGRVIPIDHTSGGEKIELPTQIILKAASDVSND